MNRDTMIKWLSENTTREQWLNERNFELPENTGWFVMYSSTGNLVRSDNNGAEDIKLENVFCVPEVIHDNSMTDYINHIREWFKSNIKPEDWGLFAMPGNWNWGDDNHDINTVIKHDWLTEKFNYSDIFGIGEMPPVKRKELFVDGAKYKLFHDETNGLNDSGSIYTYEAMNDLFNGDDSINLWRGDAVRERKQGARVDYEPYTHLELLTPEAISEGYVLTDDVGVPVEPEAIQAPYTDTAYWDKHHKKYCYIVGSAWDDGALFFAEEFVDGDVTGNYFATERMNLVAGDKRASIIDIIEEELTQKDHGKGTAHCVETIVDRILSEVINHDK